MLVRKRHQPADASVGGGDCKRKTPPAPEFHTCNFLIEAVSPEFDPKTVLLCRFFFINETKTRYVSAGFYPTQNYRPMVEFGGSKIKPVILTEEHVATMAEYLPKKCEAMCDDETYGDSDGVFRLHTSGKSKIARLHMDNHYITLKFQELRYLLNMFYVQNQLNSYIAALPDVMTYVISALNSTTYVVPKANVSNLILYPRLFEELKTVI